MGLATFYYAVSEDELNRLIKKNDSNDILEELDKLYIIDAKRYTDLDKSWDTLHFILTGSHDEIEKSEISQAFFGITLLPIEKNSAGLYYIEVENVDKIAKVICKLKFSDFSNKLEVNEDFDHDEWLWIEEYFINFQKFYHNASSNNLAVITFIG